MGKAVRWLKGLLGIKKDKEFPDKKVNKRWSFGRLSSDTRAVAGQVPGDMTPVVAESPWRVRSYLSDSEKEQNKHAIAVAAATAAAADAAMAAAQAAAAVVKLTSQGKGGGAVSYGRREKWAAVKVQTFFRGYLVILLFCISASLFPKFLFLKILSIVCCRVSNLNLVL